MIEMSVREAVRETISREMERDPSVILIGEDLYGGMGASGQSDSWGGAMRVLKGLASRFGTDRIIDTPISETAFLGAAAAAAQFGMRPVVEIMFVDFFGVCFDQVLNNIAKFRFMSNGQISTPLTIRTIYGAGVGGGAQHSQVLYAPFVHIPGIKVVAPSNAADARGLLVAAIRDEDPVIVFEHRMLYEDRCAVPEGDHVVPIGQADVLRRGDDIVIVAVGAMVRKAVEAADVLARDHGIAATVIDPRTLSPLDLPTILRAVRATGRLIVMTEENPQCSFAQHVIASVVQTIEPRALRARPRALTAPHCPVPFAQELEDAYVPSAGQLIALAREVVAEDRPKG